MLSDKLYVQQSLINNLFYLRTLREFCTTIQLSFFSNNQNIIKTAEEFGFHYEELGYTTISLSEERIPSRILTSNSFVTEYTLDCELLTEKLFGIDINTDLTVEELKLKAGTNADINKELLDNISKLNGDAIETTNNFIEFCTSILESMKNTVLFSYAYPLFYKYVIEEARLYLNDMMRIQRKENTDPTFVVNYEYRFSNSMRQACQFIVGFSDPDQTSIITNADNYRKLFSERMKSYINTEVTPDTQKTMNEETIKLVNSFIDFLSKIIEDILEQKLYFITAPIFFDNLLTEANYFLYILEDTTLDSNNKDA